MSQEKQEKQAIEQFLSVARMMPEDQILEEIQRCVSKHKVLKNNHSKLELTMYIQLWMMKTQIDKDGMMKVMNEINDIYKMKDAFNNSKHN